VGDTNALTQRISELGEPLYGKVEPSGYPNTGEGWLGTASLFGRVNFAATLMSGQVPGVKVDGARFDGKDPAAIAREILSTDLSPTMRDALQKAFEGKEPTPRFVAGLIMGSPDFQKR
jgi:uncharacterized protein (DUF1800 family)